MIKFLQILIISTLSTNCFAIDLVKYYVSFRDAAINSKTLKKQQLDRMNTITIRLAKIDEIPDSYKALCLDKTNEVLVNEQVFLNDSEFGRQEIIDHELGHCILHRSHYNLSIMYGDGKEKPTDIMHHTGFSYESEAQMKEMRKNLFNSNYYGTYDEVNKLYKKSMMETIINNNALISENIPVLRAIEHRVMEERKEKESK
jgi:hypothetical protein